MALVGLGVFVSGFWGLGFRLCFRVLGFRVLRFYSRLFGGACRP